MAQTEQQASSGPFHNTGVGPRLKAARESAGLSLVQMGERTKIPARMLALIEAGDFAALPARTYATGFTRSYARALGLDEQAMVASVRAELGMADQVETRVAPAFEPGDPARVPSAQFAWLAAVAALVVVAAGLFLWRTYYAPAVALPSLLPAEAASAAPSTAVPALVRPAAPLPEMASVPAAAIAPQAASGVPAPAAAPAVPLTRPAPGHRAPQAGAASPAPLASPAGAGSGGGTVAGAASPAQAPAAPAPASTAQN